MKPPKTDAQRANEAVFSPMKIDLEDRIAALERVQAIRESVRKMIERISLDKPAG